MTAHTKLSSIEEKIQKLNKEKEQLLQKRAKEISEIIKDLDLSHISNNHLVGALLYIKDHLSKETHLKEEWQQAGRKFLKASTQKRKRSEKTKRPKGSDPSTQKPA